MTKKAVSDEKMLVPWTDSGIPWECPANASMVTYYDFINRVHVNTNVTWKENKPFDAVFKIVEIVASTDRSRVALRETQNGKMYFIRDKEFIEAVNETSTIFGVILGKWKVSRTVGRHYGLELVDTLTQKPPEKGG